MTRSRLSILIALALALFAAPAHAGVINGYVCYSTYDPSPASALGNAGYLYATFTSGPSCTGTQVGNNYFCSTGATSASCGRVYSERALLHLADRLQAAAAVNQRIMVATDSLLRFMYVYFRAD